MRKAWIAVGVAALVALSACGSPSPSAVAAKTAVVVDTDMSWDDVAALAYLLERPDIDIRAIAVAGDGLTHCDAGFNHVRQIVAYLGHAPVPVGCGRTVPLDGSEAFPNGWRQAADAFFGLKLPPVPDSETMPTAVGVLGDAIGRSSQAVVIELGPMTNLAEILMVQPQLRKHVAAIYAMAGAISVRGNELTNARAEWNVFIDPRAARLVFESGVPVTLVPLDASDDVPVTTFFRDALGKVTQSPGALLLSNLFTDAYYYSGAQYFWDPAAAVVAMDPSVARIEHINVSVVEGSGADHGRTVQAADGTAMDVAMNVVPERFYDEYLAVVSGDAKATVPVPANRLELTYTAAGWSIRDATQAKAGPMALRLDNQTSNDVAAAVVLVTGGRTLLDVDALLSKPVPVVPAWAGIVMQVTTARGHPATWGVDLKTGLYVVVGGGPGIPLQRLAAVQVP